MRYFKFLLFPALNHFLQYHASVTPILSHFLKHYLFQTLIFFICSIFTVIAVPSSVNKPCYNYMKNRYQLWILLMYWFLLLGSIMSFLNC